MDIFKKMKENYENFEEDIESFLYRQKQLQECLKDGNSLMYFKDTAFDRVYLVRVTKSEKEGYVRLIPIEKKGFEFIDLPKKTKYLFETREQAEEELKKLEGECL